MNFLRTGRKFLGCAVAIVICLALPAIAADKRIPMGEYEYVQAFYHDGQAFIFGKSRTAPLEQRDNCANWWSINPDPSTGFQPSKVREKMSSKHENVVTFAIDGHPFILSQHANRPVIWRVNDQMNGLTVVNYKKGPVTGDYLKFVSFVFNGEPYILGLHRKMGANIWRLRLEPDNSVSIELVKYKAKMSPKYSRVPEFANVLEAAGVERGEVHLDVFYVGDQPYIFGVHRDVGANIWRVVAEPAGSKEPLRLDLVTYATDFSPCLRADQAAGKSCPASYDFVRTFQSGGRPYVLAVVTKDYMKNLQTAVRLMPVPSAVVKGVAEAGVDIASLAAKWADGYATIWSIDPDDLSVQRASDNIALSHRYRSVTTFEQDGKPYVFGIHEEGYANIWRIDDNAPTMGLTLAYYGKK